MCALLVVALAALPSAAAARGAFVTNFGSDNVSAFEFGAGGALSALAGSPYTAGDGPEGVAVSPDGRHLYTTNFFSDDVSGFAIGADGALSALGGSPFATGGSNPSFFSLAIEPNQGPTARFSITAAAAASQTRGGSANASVAAGELTRFNAAGSNDPDGQIATYAWDFGDGTTLASGGPAPSHRYERAGSYTATLSVTDNERCSATRIFTGQTAHCNATAAALARRTIAVQAAQQSPPTSPQEDTGQPDEQADETATDGPADQSAIAGEGADDGGSLPFTGLELVLLVYLGAALLTAGAALRQHASNRR